MKFQWPFARKASPLTVDQLIQRLEAVHESVSGISVTPENCMQAPTVHSIVTAISRRISTFPVRVLLKTTSNGRAVKEPQPSHPIAKLLARPNEWESSVSYWLDATSWLVRYGNYYAVKGRGLTGPIRRLVPLHSGAVTIEQDDDRNIVYRVMQRSAAQREYQPFEMHHVRGPARDGLIGDSPVADVMEAIALEIAAEKFGASFFGNGAMPFVVFKYMQGFGASTEGGKRFIEQFREAFSHRGRFRAMLLPNGVEIDDPINVQNDRAQFIETRKYQRTVIAGAFGVPVHLVGDLERGTFNNVEQQSIDFVQSVVLPYVRIFESAMERDLLTDQDRRAGIIIRFNIDGALRGDFKSRQEGLKIQREMGVISPNDWREMENQNPISEEDGGEDYWRQGPSGQSGGGAAEPPPGENDAD
jgi:HK97 family phage portal protein